MGFSNYWGIVLNLSFTENLPPLSKGIVKVKIGIYLMLFCHLHSSRQTHLYPACEHLYAKMDAEGFRTDVLTADFWMNGRRRYLPGKMVINPGHKGIENLT